METITINTTREDSLGKQLLSIRDFLVLVKSIPENEILLDFINYKYSPPLLSVFFSSYLESCPKSTTGNITSSYLESIYFPGGLKHDHTDNWEAKLEDYSRKTYLPLIHFSAAKTSELSEQRNNIISKAGKMIMNIANLPVNYYTGISYLISEITDNIVDHSKKERGWLSFQYYPKKEYIDLCIADSGRGVLNSYLEYSGENDYTHIKTHSDAIDNVIKGNSTKSSNERGFGVHTSREMLIKGLNGTFIFLSGNAMIANYDLIELNCNYSGTLLAIRIPCNKIASNFNVINYVEY